MKKMTCKQLGGACDLVFEAEHFEEIMRLIKEHGSKMLQKGDTKHIEAMKAIQKLMQSPKAMEAWMEEKRRLFETMT